MVWAHWEAGVGWIMTGEPAGPAGTIELLLDSVRVSVDATDPARLVELVALDDSDAALAAVRALIGDPAAELMLAGTTGAEAAQTECPAWRHVSELALAELAAQRHTAAPGLAALEVVRCAHEIADVCGNLLRDRAWQALPAVAALGRMAERHPELVDTLPGPDRELLAAAIATLTSTLTADGWDDSGGEAIRNLSALLAATPDDIGPLLDDEESAPTFRGPPLASDAVSWQVSSDELRPRLGSLAAAAFTGATANGQVPGSIVVHVPLRADLATAVPPIMVRVLTWQGTVLSEQLLKIDNLPDEIPHGSCLLPVAVTDDTGPLDAADITIDIALAALPPPDADSLRQTARSRAARAGKEAVLAHRAGRRRDEAEYWHLCAKLLRAAGEPVLAEQADASAHGPVAPPASWVDAALNRLRSVARAVRDPAGPPREEHIAELRLLVRDLSFALNADAELMAARRQLARVLLDGDEDDRDEAANQLSEALQVAYLLGDAAAAAQLLRTLHDLSGSETVQ
jgi:hypothetical protein